MSHIVVALFAAFLGLVVWLCYRPRATWRIAIPVSIVGLLLTATWSFPLVATQSYTSSMRYEKVTEYTNWLFGPGTTWHLLGAHIPLPTPVWLWVLVLAGVLGGVYWLRRSTLIIVVWATVFAVVFRYWPQDQAVWNTRFIPFYFLALAFLAALGMTELLRLFDYVARAVSRWVNETTYVDPAAPLEGAPPVDAATAVDASAVEVPAVDALVVEVPAVDALAVDALAVDALAVDGYTRAAREQRRRQRFVSGVRFAVAIVLVSAVTMITADDQGGGLAASWANWNYSGYQSKPAWPEYSALDVEHGPARQAARLRSRALGTVCGRDRRDQQLRHDASRSSSCPTGRTAASARWRACTSSRRPRTTSHFLTVSELADAPVEPGARPRVRHDGATSQLGVRAPRDARRALSDVLDERSQSARRSIAAAPTVAHRARRRPAGPQGLEGLRGRATGRWSRGSTPSRSWSRCTAARARSVAGRRRPPDGRARCRELEAWECATDAVVVRDVQPPGCLVGTEVVAARRLQAAPAHEGHHPGSPPSSSIHTNGPRSRRRQRADDIHRRVSDVQERVVDLFHVAEIGKPVVVRTSYFPNWQAHGATVRTGSRRT